MAGTKVVAAVTLDALPYVSCDWTVTAVEQFPGGCLEQLLIHLGIWIAFADPGDPAHQFNFARLSIPVPVSMDDEELPDSTGEAAPIQRGRSRALTRGAAAAILHVPLS